MVKYYKRMELHDTTTMEEQAQIQRFVQEEELNVSFEDKQERRKSNT